LKELLSPDWLGIYVNADDIERTIRAQGGVCVSDFGVDINQQHLSNFLSQNPTTNRLLYYAATNVYLGKSR